MKITVVRGFGAILALGLVFVLAFAGTAVAGKKSSTYAIGSDVRGAFAPGMALKKPKQFSDVDFSGNSASQIFSKLKKWKNWGSKKTQAEVKTLSICNISINPITCSATKKGTLTFKNPRKNTCEVKPGKMKIVWLYSKMIGKQPKHKGFPKGNKAIAAPQLESEGPKPPPLCPLFF